MTNVAQRGFSRGEVAPSQYAGTDREAYRQALRTLLNGYVMRSGGVRSRPGTTYKGTSKSSGAARLVPCVFDDDQNYVLEFGELYVRFWKDGALVTGTVTGGWADATVYAAGIVVSYSSTNYVCLVAHTSVLATNRPSTGASWQTYWYALSGTTYELPTAYAASIRRELQFNQTLGVLRIAHNTIALKKLIRVANAQWYFEAIASAPSLAAPANLSESHVTAGTVVSWVVTAYDSVNQIESLASAAVSWDTEPALADIAVLDWDAVTGATSYRVYKSLNGAVYGYAWEQTTAGPWSDNGSRVIDLTTNPPAQQSTFTTSGNYPGVLGGFQQRVFHSGSVNEPDLVRGSKVAARDDFTVSSPLVDSDAVSWKMVSDQVVRVRHLREVGGRFYQFTNIGEGPVDGDDTGIITPGGINPQIFSNYGAAKYPAPMKAADAVVYVQEAGSVVRSIFANGSGEELSVLGSHLVDGYTLYEATYQKNPHSLLWFVRSDGALLSLTYVPDMNVLAWAKHTTDGTVESIACVKESTEDAVYLLVNRTINASTVRYVERLADRGAAVTALVLSDSAVTASGAHPHSTLSITGGAGSILGSGYSHTGETATGSGGSGSFTSADVGRTFSFVYTGIRGYGLITGYTSGTVVTVSYWWPSGTDLSNPQAFTTGNWWWTSVNGLSHLHSEPVSVVVDGVVLASPYNASATATVTVTSAGIANFGGVDSGFSNVASLDATGTAATAAFTTAIIGLPFVVDIGTLDIDSVSSSRKDAGVDITRIGLWLESSRLPFAASAFPSSATAVTDMVQLPNLDDDLNATTGLISGYREGIPNGAFTTHGRVALRHVDPSPLTVLAIVAQGTFGRS